MKFILVITSLFILNSCVNKNNINNKNLDKQCYEKPKTGFCRAYFKIYYYDKNSKTCKSSVWGGCGGNVPFKSLNNCKKTCEQL